MYLYVHVYTVVAVAEGVGAGAVDWVQGVEAVCPEGALLALVVRDLQQHNIYIHVDR